MRTVRTARPALVALAALVLAVAADLLAGRGVPVDRFAAAVLDPGSLDGQIVWLLRVPRMLTAVLAGAALGVAGVILQSTLANPLASPDTTGVSGAAVFGVVVVTATALVPRDSTTGMLWAALAAGLLGSGLVYLLASRLGPERQLLCGVLAAGAMGGAITLFLSVRTSQFGTILRWLVGSVDARVWADLAGAAPWILAWLLIAALASPLLPILVGGDAHAAAVGLAPRRTRLLLLVTAVALAAGAAALAGAITFLGLAVPHLTRLLVDRASRWVVPIAAAIGAALLVGCDAIAQTLTMLLAGAQLSQRAGIPAGAVAAVAGAVALVALIRRAERP
ncbi:iron chelate uptake ABC transporter family permease subunit [Nakamurella sp.]|uniref:iron chelate uptake ABC transporter family permease subunit n=1 Tax=Nakamurella sp. TaxID=1869182 RepID=UPI0037844BFD